MVKLPSVTEVQFWRSFIHDGVTYDLSHLDAKRVSYVDPKTNTEFFLLVTYSMHCFTKEDPLLDESLQTSLLYRGHRESRPFHLERYELSKRLPLLVERLPELHVFDAGYKEYAIVEITTASGEKAFYKVVFAVFKEEKKFRLHVASAYPVPEVGKTGGKVRFFSILHNLKNGKPLPRNQ
jgi:hypothetical protein